MKYLVGYSSDQGGREALALGGLLARSNGGSLVVCTIVPETWGHPSVARVDLEYATFLDQHAKKVLARAREAVDKNVPAEFVARTAPSGREGLLQVAADVGADCIVLGSARAASIGRFAEGSVTSGILRSASVPVALAPKGFAPRPQARIKRVSCAYSGAKESVGLARRSIEFCQAFNVPLRLATLIVRDKQMYPTGAGYSAENLVSNQMKRQAKEAQDEIIGSWNASVGLTGAIGDGKTWRAAIDSLAWLDAEVIVVGSSGLGPFLRVFLGSNSGKIVCNSPVPCIILPRGGEVEAL